MAAAERLSLRRLLEGSEAFAVCAYLPPSELACLTSTASWKGGCGDRKALWQTYFIVHWGAELGVRRDTQVRIMLSWLDEDWLHHTAFNGSQTMVDHICWFVPSFKRALANKSVKPLPPPPPVLRWQMASKVQAWYPSSTRLVRCFICDSLEVSPPVPAPCHFRQRWTRPCSCSLRLAHRACLERRLLQENGALRRWLFWHLHSPERVRVKLACEECGKDFLITRRFPETFEELCWATIREWRWVAWRVFVALLCFLWLFMLAEHYCAAPEGGREVSRFEVSLLLIFTSCMMSISLSLRFQCAVQMVWNSGHQAIYFRAFALFATLCYLTGLRVVDPSLWGPPSEARGALVSGLQTFHTVLRTSALGRVGLSAVSFTYAVAASGVVFLFWKTSLRVLTVADAKDAGGGRRPERGSPEGVAGHPSGSFKHECGLCQLGLCLDNMYM